MTGMTRDGVFWVENGGGAVPGANLRFTQSYSQSLADVIAVGDPCPLLKAQYGQDFRARPAIGDSKVRFTS